jgi:hypothetical protein
MKDKLLVPCTPTPKRYAHDSGHAAACPMFIPVFEGVLTSGRARLPGRQVTADGSEETGLELSPLSSLQK